MAPANTIPPASTFRTRRAMKRDLLLTFMHQASSAQKPQNRQQFWLTSSTRKTTLAVQAHSNVPALLRGRLAVAAILSALFQG